MTVGRKGSPMRWDDKIKMPHVDNAELLTLMRVRRTMQGAEDERKWHGSG